MTKDKADVVLGAQIGQPVPAKNTFYTVSDIFQIREDQFKKQLGVGFIVLMQFDFPLAVEDACIQKHVFASKLMFK
jgi:hypothetical protein